MQQEQLADLAIISSIFMHGAVVITTREVFFNVVSP